VHVIQLPTLSFIRAICAIYFSNGLNVASSISIVHFIRDFLELVGVTSVAGVVVALLRLLREAEEGVEKVE
jgi:hypothetical protein